MALQADLEAEDRDAAGFGAGGLPEHLEVFRGEVDLVLVLEELLHLVRCLRPFPFSMTRKTDEIQRRGYYMVQHGSTWFNMVQLRM